MYYYPFIENEAIPLKSSITLSNYPPVTRKVSVKESYIYSVHSTGDQWIFQYQGQLNPFESITVERVSLSVSNEATSVFLTMSPRRLEKYHPKLIKSDHYKTSPDWRANLKICSQTTCTSYQGEYPSEMLTLNKSTMVSLCPLVQTEPTVHNKVFLVHLSDLPTIKSTTVFLANLRTQKVLKTYEVKTNTINCISLPSMSEQSYLFNPSMISIPIYLTHNDSFTELSMEHSHPPHEFTMGGYMERHSLIKSMKKWWISKGLLNVT